MLVKHGEALLGDVNEIAVIVDTNDSMEDVDQIQVDDGQASALEANDDFIVTFLSGSSLNLKYLPFFLSHIHYGTPTLSSLARPPSNHLS